MLFKQIYPVLVFLLQFYGVYNKEAVYIINGKKYLNVVSQRFLSFSIDPISLLRRLNETSRGLHEDVVIQHLHPGFLRLSGLSVELQQFSLQDNVSLDDILTVTPTTWKDLHKWFKNIQLTPIIAINDRNGANGTWNPKTLLPFLDINEEIGFNCFWQLGYDCDYKHLSHYKEDLLTLKHILEMYSSSKIIGSNLRSCTSINSDLAKKTVEDLEGTVEAIAWEPSHIKRDAVVNGKIPIWLITPKAKRPQTFFSALKWAKQIGESAKNGYKVIFWQTDLEDLLEDTAVFWVSLIYKRLIGQTVLDIKTNSLVQHGLEVSAYCAKQYPKQGAMVVFTVNGGNHEFTASIRVASTHPNSIDVHCYVVTSDDHDNTYLNGEKLTLDFLQTNRFILIPKIKRLKVHTLLNLNVPPKSIAFFVMPAAGIPLCNSSTEEYNYVSTEVTDNFPIMSKFGEIKDTFKKFRIDELRKTIEDRKIALEDKPSGTVGGTADDFTHFSVNKQKLHGSKNDKTAAVIFTETRMKEKPLSNHPRQIELELTNDEIKKILLDRAKSRVSQSDDRGLGKQMVKAAQKQKRFATVRPLKRRLNSRKLRNKLLVRKRERRDINMELLKKRIGHRSEKQRDVYADLAPAKFSGRNLPESIEEDVLKSGEKFLDERIRFLTEPGGIDSAVEDELTHGFYENFNAGRKDYKSVETASRSSGSNRWLQHRIRSKRHAVERNLFRSKTNFEKTHRRIALRKRHNQDSEINERVKALKEKLENRKKMNNWIREQQKARLKRATYYVPKLIKEDWGSNDVQAIKKKPSYSIEMLDGEFVQNFPTLKRYARAFDDVDITENEIDEHHWNKIPKMKEWDVVNIGTSAEVTSATVTTSPFEDDVNCTSGYKKLNVTQTLSMQEDDAGKSFIHDIIEYVSHFIEDFYGKISGYFIS